MLEQLSERIWIPYHVALEFQRNRLKVIAEQNKRFSEVRRTIEKARDSLSADLDKLQLQNRHSLTNPQPLTTGFKKLVDDFLAELGQLQETQQKLSAPDLLKIQIETLFAGRVGDPPKNQAAIDELYKQAGVRFKFKIPPGYQDADKDKDESDGYLHGGIIYKRKYGDYLVWKQILAHAKATNTKSVIFVTDDGKDDWWRKIDSDGPKTIGPRPEIIEEARLSASVEFLLLYNPESFLKYAKESLQAQVSEKTLNEVRDVSNTRSLNEILQIDQPADSDLQTQVYQVVRWPSNLILKLSPKHRRRFQKLREERHNDPNAQAVWDVIKEKCMEGDFEDATLFLNLWWHRRTGESDELPPLPPAPKVDSLKVLRPDPEKGF